jgi:N-acylglucosamine 2-epimerase
MKKFAQQYLVELTDNIIPFWLNHSKDETNGGYFTCLDRNGNIFDTDKFMWLQGREVWCFSMLCNKLGMNNQWLDMALHGADFMKKFGRDSEGNWYFSLTAEGKPLIQPYNIFSDCFAAMGFGALYKITGKQEHCDIAVDTFQNIIKRQHNTKGIYNKSYPGTRPLRNFSLPMILCNLSLELEHIIGSEKVNAFAPEVIHDVMDVFHDASSGLILENVAPDGSFVDCFEGRLINPGHAIESMWFIIDLASRFGNQQLAEKAKDIMLHTLEYGWDDEHGGIFYFLDMKGHPLQQLEWDQKLWWVHVEALVGLAKAYAATGDQRCADWFRKIHTYTWDHFKDAEYPEWFGYLNREGKPLLTLKGGKWKGCFHIPRALYQVANTLSGLPAGQLLSTTVA